jgi:hypothetical protein
MIIVSRSSVLRRKSMLGHLPRSPIYIAAIMLAGSGLIHNLREDPKTC